MFHRHPPQSRAVEDARVYQPLPLQPRPRRELTLVERFRRELADRWRQSPCCRQEHASAVGHRLVSLEEILQGRDADTVRVAGLLRLLQLLWIAKQNEGGGRRRYRQHTRKRHLP